MPSTPTPNAAAPGGPAVPSGTAVPAGACDAHAHVFGNPTDYPVTATADYRPAEASSTSYHNMLARIGFERAVIVQPSVYGLDNRCTLEALRWFGPGRARGIAMISPDIPEADLRALDQQGIRGVRFITVATGGPSLSELEAVAERIAPLGWHVQMYLPAAAIAELEPVIRRLPVPVVLDHMAGLRSDDQVSGAPHRAVLSLLDTGGCWVKLSGYRASVAGPPYLDLAELARRLHRSAPTRCVWGTDWPHPNLSTEIPDDQALLALFLDWFPDPAHRRQILVDNPARLYQFPDLPHQDPAPHHAAEQEPR